jgi:hypothetical protein
VNNIAFGISTLAIGVLFFVFTAVAGRPSKHNELEEFDPAKRMRRNSRRVHAIIAGSFSLILGIGFVGSGIAQLSGSS